MVDKKLGGAGLRGQVAGTTALCTVGKTGTGLTYRGYDISVLACRICALVRKVTPDRPNSTVSSV